MVSIKFISAIIVLLALTSCATKPVEVAYDCAIVELPADPIPATRDLKDDSTPDEVVKAYRATVYDYQQWDIIVRDEIRSVSPQKPARSTV